MNRYLRKCTKMLDIIFIYGKLSVVGLGSLQPNKKFLRGGLNQSVSGSVGQLDAWQAHLGIPLIMMPRPHPETNENQHKRFAQHIGSPRRGAPGRRRQK